MSNVMSFSHPILAVSSLLRAGCLATFLLSPLASQSATITTVAGTGTPGFTGDGGPAAQADISYPYGIAVDTHGNVFFIHWDLPSVVRRIDAATGVITTVAGGGFIGFPNDGQLATDVALSNYPYSIGVDPDGNLYIGEYQPDGMRIRHVSSSTGIITTVAGGGPPTNFFALPPGVLVNGGRNQIPLASGDGGLATSAYVNGVSDIAFDAAGNLFFGDWHQVRRVDAATGIITTVAGNGIPEWVSIGGGGILLGIYSGDGGPAVSAGLVAPQGITVSSSGDLYVSEYDLPERATVNQRIRKVDAATGIITTVAGTGEIGYSGDGGLATNATLDGPFGLATDDAGHLYIADVFNSVIRRVEAGTGIITTIAGDGTFGFGGDGGPAESATLNAPIDLAFHLGNLFLTDIDNSRVRKISGLSPNLPPTANAGPDQAIHASGVVQLDGSASFDDNTATSSLVYTWTLVTRPPGSAAVLAAANSVTPSFVADLPGSYIVELVVFDANSLASAPDQVEISSTNLAPTANAGADHAGVVGVAVQLDGTASTDAEMDPMFFVWGFTQMPAGSAATLSDSFVASPTFVPDVAGTYVIGLFVYDSFGPSALDEVAIIVITGEQFAENTTVAAISLTSELPVTSVTTGGNQQAMVQFLSQAVQSVQSNNLAEARLKLQMGMARCDGWTLRGSADQSGPGRDWVTEESAARELYGQLLAALNALNP